MARITKIIENGMPRINGEENVVKESTTEDLLNGCLKNKIAEIPNDKQKISSKNRLETYPLATVIMVINKLGPILNLTLIRVRRRLNSRVPNEATRQQKTKSE
jgi:hypothetical protein